VTGAARGMGAHFARALSEAGAQVAAGDVDEAGLAALPAAVHKSRLDVASSADCVSFVAWAHGAMGGLNGLVNNAGILRDGLLVKKDRETGKVIRLTSDQWNAVIGVNLTGVFLCAREAAAHMIERGNGGVIVNISSISRAGNAGQSNYSAAKAGVESMSVVWAKELARYGIRCGSIAPGFTHTEILSAMRPEVLDKLTAPVPLKRLGEPEEIAHAVLFIFENDFFTGRCLEVDGGLRL
ncbi:MAG TPA: SDR family oxidoreductase, partial [Steroidobacteraceae bacterium]|nr:SDR family oxidoreductase [Steroidobacteraceae bacterium]